MRDEFLSYLEGMNDKGVIELARCNDMVGERGARAMCLNLATRLEIALQRIEQLDGRQCPDLAVRPC